MEKDDLVEAWIELAEEGFVSVAKEVLALRKQIDKALGLEGIDHVRLTCIVDDLCQSSMRGDRRAVRGNLVRLLRLVDGARNE